MGKSVEIGRIPNDKHDYILLTREPIGEHPSCWYYESDGTGWRNSEYPDQKKCEQIFIRQQKLKKILNVK